MYPIEQVNETHKLVNIERQFEMTIRMEETVFYLTLSLMSSNYRHKFSSREIKFRISESSN